MFMPSIFGNNFVDNFFDDFDPRKNREYAPQLPSFMKTDIKESDDSYDIDIELPGFDKEDVKAQLTNGYLIISAEKTENKEEKDDKKKYIRKERYSGSCSRSFYVGDTLTQNDIKAKFDKGVLTLTVPKHVEKPVEENKYISIA